MDLDQKSKGWGSQVSRTRPVRWSWNESCTPEAKRNSKHESINQNDPTLFNSKINILHITIVYRKAARVSFQHEIPAHPISRLPTTTSGGSFRASITGSVFMLAVASALL